jgi:hypothetical protein
MTRFTFVKGVILTWTTSSRSCRSIEPVRGCSRGTVYFLGIEQIRDVVVGLEGQLGRSASSTERLRAVLHFARHDAFIDPELAADP